MTRYKIVSLNQKEDKKKVLKKFDESCSMGSLREWLQLFYATEWNKGDWKVDLEIKTTMIFGV